MFYMSEDIYKMMLIPSSVDVETWGMYLRCP